MRPQYTTGHGIELSRVTSMTRCTSRGTKIRWIHTHRSCYTTRHTTRTLHSL